MKKTLKLYILKYIFVFKNKNYILKFIKLFGCCCLELGFRNKGESFLKNLFFKTKGGHREIKKKIIIIK